MVAGMFNLVPGISNGVANFRGSGFRNFFAKAFDRITHFMSKRFLLSVLIFKGRIIFVLHVLLLLQERTLQNTFRKNQGQEAIKLNWRSKSGAEFPTPGKLPQGNAA
jgi:hypothetical protein